MGEKNLDRIISIRLSFGNEPAGNFVHISPVNSEGQVWVVRSVSLLDPTSDRIGGDSLPIVHAAEFCAPRPNLDLGRFSPVVLRLGKVDPPPRPRLRSLRLELVSLFYQRLLQAWVGIQDPQALFSIAGAPGGFC